MMRAKQAAAREDQHKTPSLWRDRVFQEIASSLSVPFRAGSPAWNRALLSSPFASSSTRNASVKNTNTKMSPYVQTNDQKAHTLHICTNAHRHVHAHKQGKCAINKPPAHTLQAKGKPTIRISMTVFGFCAFFPRICESSSKAKVCFNRSHTSGRTFSQPVKKHLK